MNRFLGWVVGCVVVIFTVSGASSLAQNIDGVLQTCLAPATSKAATERRKESCTAIIERRGESPAKRAIAFSSRGWVEYGRGDYLKAITDFNSSLQLNSDFRWALAGRASAFLNSGQSDRAIPDFDRAITLYPPDPQLLIGRGDAYNNLKQYDRGIADFDRALALDPKNDEAMNDRAWALARKGKFVEAIQGYDAALSVATELRSLVLSNRCEVKAMAGDINGAISDCDAALKIKPGETWHLVTRGFANLMGERFSAAISDYDAALVADPKNAFALYGRGVARLRLGQTIAGRNDIAAAHQFQPTIREDMSELGVVAPTIP